MQKHHTFSFTVLTNETFDFDLLPQFSSEHGVQSHQRPLDEGVLITFSSDKLDCLEEVFDQLIFLNPSDIQIKTDLLTRQIFLEK